MALRSSKKARKGAIPVPAPTTIVAIAAALEHDPALSLDAVKLRRVSPMAAEVDAELQWSLHGRAAP